MGSASLNRFRRCLSWGRRRVWGEKIVLRWALEKPSAEPCDEPEEISATGEVSQSPESRLPEEHTSQGMVVQGWILLNHDLLPLTVAPQVVASLTPHAELVQSLKCLRPEVAAEVLHQDSENHPQRCCRFQFFVPNHTSSLQLSLRLGKRQFKLAKVRFEATRKAPKTPSGVLQGKAGWLFLGNDTNSSVNQHRGILQLTHRGLQAWQKYARGLQQFGNTIDVPVALLVSPAKESVLGEYHPMAAGNQSPAQQIARVLPSEMFGHPVTPMMELGDDAFLLTDTHWSDQGAMVGAVELAKTLGLASQDIVNLFAKDRYRSEQIVGDLGGKLTPQRTSLTKRLASYDIGDKIVYDNGLRSFGRIFITRTSDAYVDKTCLIFGSSSSFAMLKYASRIFSCVILVHTAGSLDPHLIAAVKPHFLVAQTNARFVIRVPLLTYSVRDHLKKKVSEFSAVQRETAIANRVCSDEAWLAQSAFAPYDRILS